MKSDAALLSSGSKLNLGLFAWLAMSCSILIWGFGEVQQGTLGNTGNVYRIALTLFSACASAWVLLRNPSRLQQAFPLPLVLLLFYAVTAIISSLYVPTYALYTMWKGFEILVVVLAMAAILTYPAPQNFARTAYKMILVLFAILIVVYLVEAMAVPSMALTASRGYVPIQLHGVLPVMPENGLAFLSAIVVFAVFCRLFRPGSMAVKILYLGFMGVALVSLVLAQSRTSVIGLVIAMVVYLFFDRRYGLFSGMALMLLIAVAYTQSSDVALQYLRRGQEAELLTTLTGRTVGWSVAWKMFLDSPLLGYGFAAFARANILGLGGASTLHGSIFDVMVGVGLLGLIPWVAAILLTSFRLLSLSFNRHPWFQTPRGRSMQAEMLGVLALTIVRMSTNSGMSEHSHEFMLFLSIVAYVFPMLRATRRRPAEAARSPHVRAHASSHVRN